MKPEWEPLGELSFDSHSLLPARNGSKVGWIDRDGNLKVRAPDALTPVSGFGTKGLAVVKDENNLAGCVNLQGEVVIAPLWEHINVNGYSYTGDDGERRRDDNLIAVTRKNPSSRSSGTSKGYLRTNGDVVVAADYDFIMLDLSRKTATVLEVSEKWGVLDFHGNVIVPFEYDDLSLHDETGLAAAHQDSKWGWINQKGEIAIPFEFNDYSRQNLSRPFNQRGLAMVRKGDQWGAIDSAGKVVVPFEYSGAKHCGLRDDWLGFRQNGRWGCIDHHGNVVVPFEYDAPVIFEIETLATLRKGSWFHAMDRSGRVHPERTLCELRTLVDDLKISDWRKSMDTYNRLVAGKFLAAVELDSSLTGVGQGIFSTELGMIVPPIHSDMLITQYGFRGDGCGRKPTGVFEKPSAVPRQLLERIIGPIARPKDKLQVLYDFQGKEIWRSDARYRDLLKAWSLLFAGVGCVVCWRWAKRSKAIAS